MHGIQTNIDSIIHPSISLLKSLHNTGKKLQEHFYFYSLDTVCVTQNVDYTTTITTVFKLKGIKHLYNTHKHLCSSALLIHSMVPTPINNAVSYYVETVTGSIDLQRKLGKQFHPLRTRVNWKTENYKLMRIKYAHSS